MISQAQKWHNILLANPDHCKGHISNELCVYLGHIYKFYYGSLTVCARLISTVPARSAQVPLNRPHGSSETNQTAG